MGLGPRPEGSPGQMRALAAQIKAAGSRLGSLPTVRFDEWESPTARQARALISANVSTCASAVGQLGQASALLLSEAEELEAKQKAWDARKKALDAKRKAERDDDPLPSLALPSLF